MKNLPLSLILPAVLLVSCASDSDKKKSAAAAPASQGATERSVADWVSEKSKDNGFKKNEKGSWVPKSDKRSSYDQMGQDPNFANKTYKKEAYKPGDFSKKSFWGNKEFDRKAYAGNTDGGKFQKASKLGEKGARESSTNAKLPDNYDTNGYATNSAREAGNAPITKGTNDQIENKRNDFERPDIIDYREQRQMSKAQTTTIMGR
ncbi:hypothetical protein JIN84_14175 [Luteolibacter yonseiensis]|uniref:Lipoprotein n=1 Tax=Luteolibacter yonseiensis TaxID=1144680 RepID=A0A934R7Y9_9BACT|nr:hypothetical protein [Luteolibacter yonseiensis]MBK1816769.1 hypothetical protein [Luteolibacter yonseiensis]